MIVTDPTSGTNVAEIADGIYRINTPVELPGAQAFSFNQYLVVADEPLLFHTGPRQLFALVLTAVGHVLRPDRLRHIAFSHVEADECGSLNQWLAVAPQAAPLCGSVAAMVSIADLADRPPQALADGESIDLGGKTVQWLDAPHVPHGWECGFLAEQQRRPCSAETCSRNRVQDPRPFARTISSPRARDSGSRWIIMRMDQIRATFLNASPRLTLRPWPACMGARGVATAPP
jgi:hypothetical protein